MAIAWTLAQALYLFSPLLVAAALSAVIHRYDLVHALARPIDGGRTFRGQRVFGDGKTWRGVAIAIVGSVAAVAAQRFVVGDRAGRLAILRYAEVDPIVFGAALGAAAMLGELPNSFVKRRLGIARGETASRPAQRLLFWVWDQIDLLITSWPVLRLWIRPSAELVIASFALGLVLHPLVAFVGWLVKARGSAR